MYSNAAVNPIIYAGLNENFRKGFKDLINGVVNRKSPNASAEFESEYKQRSTLRARGSRVALVAACESTGTFDPTAMESVAENELPAVENGISNVNYFLFGAGNPFDENETEKAEADPSEAKGDKDIDSGLGNGHMNESNECMSKF